MAWPVKVAIVGGGISGLSCAHYLQRANVDATVFDPRPGGCIGTVIQDGCVLETGPESWLASKPWAEQLIRELGLGGELADSNDAQRKTYILRHGRFVAMPEGLQLVVPTRALPIVRSHLFTWTTKLRMASEVFRSPRTAPDRSVSEFVREHFGEEAVDYLAEPLLAGVYGGSPDELSAPSVLPKLVAHEQRYGSVVVGSLRHPAAKSPHSIFRSLKNGMGTLIDALRARATVIESAVDAIGHNETGWGVRVAGEWHGFDQVVLACGANHSAALVAPIDERSGEILASIPHSSSAIWTFGYRREDIRHPLDAFGFLVPKKERRAIMACTWVNTKWIGRVPEGKAVLRCFSGGALVTREEVLADLTGLMGITAEPLFTLHHEWPDSMPQYTVGHSARIAELETRIQLIPGLHIAGNAYHGIGIPDCVKSAREAAREVLETAAARL